jgi:hypothetical protein
MATGPGATSQKRTLAIAIIIVMQRLHIDDLCGHLLKPGHDWTVLKLAAIAEQDEHIHASAPGRLFRREPRPNSDTAAGNHHRRP